MIQVISGQEEKIVKLIDQERFHAFIPKKVKFLIRKGVKIRVYEPLFRGYVFVETDADALGFQAFLLERVKPLKEFVRVLRHREQDLETVYPEEKAWILKYCDRQMVIEPSIGYIEGDRILITEGPLVGQEHLIKRVNRHKRWVEVELMMFDQIQRLQLSCDIIQKLQD